MSETAAQAETWTVKALLDWTTTFFRKKGSESPRLEAEILLAFALGKTRVDLYVCFDDVPDESTRAKFRELVQRRGRGEPIAYLVGKKEFYSLELDVDSRALIPRPETETLALETIEFFRKLNGAPRGAEGEGGEGEDGKVVDAAPELPKRRVCEVGVGSGCLSIAIAKNVPNVEIVALDLSRDALDLARSNAAKQGVDEAIRFVESDLFAALDPTTEAPFDAIVSNPPYVSESEYAALDPTVRDFEPEIALVGGATGAELPIRLVRQAPDFLRSGGLMALELSPTTIDSVVAAMKETDAWSRVDALPDFARIMRYVVATRK